MALMRRLGCLVASLAALAALAGCEGRTTGVSDVNEETDGTYSAKLNAVGSCEQGSRDTPCTAYLRWREVGTDDWTTGRRIEVPREVTDRPWSQTARGFSPNADYEYQACGKEFADEQVTCVGPDGTPATTEEFVPTDRPASEGQATGQRGGNESAEEGGQGTSERGGQAAAPAAGAETTAPGLAPTGDASGASDSGGHEVTSPIVPIVMVVGAIGLVLGGVWWARRGPPAPRPGAAPAATEPPHAGTLPAEVGASRGSGVVEAPTATFEEATALRESADEPATPAIAPAAASPSIAAPTAGTDAALTEGSLDTREVAESEVREVDDRAAAERFLIESTPQGSGRDTVREIEHQVEERRAGEEELTRQLQQTERRLAATQARALAAVERALARLEDVEARTADAEARASRAEGLTVESAEKIGLTRRLRETLDRIDEAERRATEAATRAREAVKRRSEPPGSDAEPIADGHSRSPPGSGAGSPSRSEAAATASEGLIDVNEATYEQLRELGLSVTQTVQLLSYREESGGFDSLEELDRVLGLPPDFFAGLKPQVRV
jgi:DNA uptake protein ComE-like DNA-binding protein